MATQPPQNPNQSGYQPQQQGYQQGPGGQPPQKSNPWPWVMGAVAIIVAGVIVALVITGNKDKTDTISTTRSVPTITNTTITTTTAPPTTITTTSTTPTTP